jgi:hypothetical protein
MTLIKIHNAETDEIIEREMNNQELAEWEASAVASKLENQKLLENATAKAALLEKLGITEDEAKLLLS